MKSFQILALVGAVFGFAHTQQYPAGALGSFNPSSSSSVSTTPRPLPPAQVHYVNIGEDLTGDYKFGYDTGKNDGGQSFREESRLPDGTVKGAYGYIDAEGKQRIVKYTAGIEGFKVESDEAAPGQGSAPAAPARSYAPQQRQAAPQASYQSPAQSQSQSLGGYTPVAQSQPRTYSPPQPQPQQAQYQPASQPAPVDYQRQTPQTYTPRAPSPLPNYSAALQAQLAAVQASGASQGQQSGQYQSGQYQPQQQSGQYRAQPISQQLPSYSATLAQRQPTLAQARPSQLASYPRSGSQSVGQSFGNVNEPQELTTWGPPVINKELLSYNIGVGRR